jgi:hypothetical protein
VSAKHESILPGAPYQKTGSTGRVFILHPSVFKQGVGDYFRQKMISDTWLIRRLNRE